MISALVITVEMLLIAVYEIPNITQQKIRDPSLPHKTRQGH